MKRRTTKIVSGMENIGFSMECDKLKPNGRNTFNAVLYSKDK